MFLKNFLICLTFFVSCLRIVGAEVNIICTTDLHGHLEAMPSLAAVINSFGKNTLKIDVGDTLSGTLLSDSLGGRPMISLLNLMKFDVWVPGNHDFEQGYSVFEKRISEFRGTVLGIQWHWRNIRPAGWKMFHINGVKIAVIGATDPAMPWRILPGIDGVFNDTTESVAAVLPEIMAQKPHVIVLAYHNGEYAKYGSIYAIARRFPCIDLILGGHSHQEVIGKRIRKSYFVQAGAHGAAVALIKIKVDDRTGKLLRIESALLHPDPEETDFSVNTLCLRWLKDEARMAEKVVAETQELYRLPSRRDKFSRLGNLGAEALLKMTGADGSCFSLAETKKTDIQRKNSKGKYVITEGRLFDMFSFTNRICLIEVERDDLAEFEMYVREFSRKRKRRYFFAGAIKMDKKGKLSCSKDKFILAVSDYVLTSLPVLQRKLEIRGKWSVVPGLFERDVMRRALKNCR